MVQYFESDKIRLLLEIGFEVTKIWKIGSAYFFQARSTLFYNVHARVVKKNSNWLIVAASMMVIYHHERGQL